MTPTCPICQAELSTGELNLNHEWHIECQICQVCKGPLDRAIFEKALRNGLAIAHSACTKLKILEELRNHEITDAISILEEINNKILVFQNLLDGQTSDVELLSAFVHTLKETGANVQDMLDHTKSKIRIKTNVEYQEKLRTEKAAKSEARVKKEAEHIKNQQLQDMYKAERDDASGTLRNRRKAIEAYLKLPGWTLEQATETVNKQMGLDPKTGEKIQ